jgi:hypothetical protein
LGAIGDSHIVSMIMKGGGGYAQVFRLRNLLRSRFSHATHRGSVIARIVLFTVIAARPAPV